MLSFLKYLLYLGLFLICAVIVSLYAYFALVTPTDFSTLLAEIKALELHLTDSQLTAIGLLALLPLYFFILFSPLVSLSDSGGWFGPFVRFLVFLSMIGFIGYQFYDQRKVYIPYSSQDLKSIHPEAGRSAFLYTPLLEKKLGPVPNLSGQSGAAFYQELLSSPPELRAAWQEIKPYRIVIDQLAELPVLTRQPPQTPLKELDFSTVEAVSRLYLAYGLLQAAEGQTEEALVLLDKIYRVARNGLAGALSLSEKMSWDAILQDSFSTAYQMALQPELTENQLGALYTTYRALNFSHSSFALVWRNEFLVSLAELDLSADQVLTGLEAPAGARLPLLLQFTPRWLFPFCYRLTFLKNRTTAVLLDFWKPIIESSKTQLPAFPKAGFSLDHYRDTPPLNNLSGWYFHRPADLADQELQVIGLQSTSVLLADYLKNRLEYDTFNEAAFRRIYPQAVIQESTLVTAGQDGEIGTGDDIVLRPLL